MIFGGEIYSGWLTHWQEDEMQVKSAGVAEEAYGFLVKHNHSFSMYMAHGGTNFALTGASAAAYMEDRDLEAMWHHRTMMLRSINKEVPLPNTTNSETDILRCGVVGPSHSLAFPHDHHPFLSTYSQMVPPSVSG